jgi:ribosomal protein S18 acetylase RimI-like enzyme
MVQGVFVELAGPDDAFLDVFCSGQERVDQYFRSRAWFAEKRKGGPVVGYASVSFRNQPHPDDASSTKAKALVISMLGVDQAFQGQPNPLVPNQAYAASIMAELEGMARSKANCVGLSLWVRSTNDQAIGFYKKVGFVTDPAGPFQLDDGDPMLTMRKLLS